MIHKPPEYKVNRPLILKYERLFYADSSFRTMPLIDFFAKIYAEGGMVQMKLIRKRRNGYALMLAVSICLAVWLGATFMIEAVFAFGAVSLISLLLLVRESRLLYDATLIWDNRIIAVPSALITIPGSHPNLRENKSINKIPSQKAGIDTPIIEAIMLTPSTHVL
jgi:hypothetical protein